MSDSNVSILWEAVDYIRVEEIKQAFPQVNFVDVFTQVRLWDVLIYNYLRTKNIIIPPKRDSHKELH